MKKSMLNREYSIVSGMGIVTSIGQDIEDYTNALKEGKCGIDFINFSEQVSDVSYIGASIGNINMIEQLEKYQSILPDYVKRAEKLNGRLSNAMKASILSVFEAWVRSGIGDSKISSNRISVVICGNNISQNLQYSTYNKYSDQLLYTTPSYALNFMDTDYVGVLSEIFNINGEGFTVGGASASGNVGIIKACQMINSGFSDVCIVVGPVADLSPLELQAFYNIGAMGGRIFLDRPRQACRPFDTEHEGFIYGQASGCLVIESEKAAQEREAKIFAKIPGWGYLLDGNRLSNPNKDGEMAAMQNAILMSGLKTYEVNYINAHGSSSPIGDETELLAIKDVFKDYVSNIWINSTKSFTGHCLFSAGVIEAIATIIQMNQNFVHPNLNLDNPIDDNFKFAGKKLENCKIETSLSNSFGFGGINTSILFTL